MYITSVLVLELVRDEETGQVQGHGDDNQMDIVWVYVELGHSHSTSSAHNSNTTNSF